MLSDPQTFICNVVIWLQPNKSPFFCPKCETRRLRSSLFRKRCAPIGGCSDRRWRGNTCVRWQSEFACCRTKGIDAWSLLRAGVVGSEHNFWCLLRQLLGRRKCFGRCVLSIGCSSGRGHVWWWVGPRSVNVIVFATCDGVWTSSSVFLAHTTRHIRSEKTQQQIAYISSTRDL